MVYKKKGKSKMTRENYLAFKNELMNTGLVRVYGYDNTIIINVDYIVNGLEIKPAFLPTNYNILEDDALKPEWKMNDDCIIHTEYGDLKFKYHLDAITYVGGSIYEII